MDKEELIGELKRNGFSDKILNAFKIVKREDFIPNGLKEDSYENIPLPIGFGQTISQPYTIAFMLDLLELSNLNDNEETKILEIGSGSGYVLALLSNIFMNSKVFGIERIHELFDISKNTLKDIKNIRVYHGDGSKGLNNKEFQPQQAAWYSLSLQMGTDKTNRSKLRGIKPIWSNKKFDRIIVSASAREIPSQLIDSLSKNGILVIPVRDSIFQIKKKGKKTIKKEYNGFIFVPLISGDKFDK